MLGAADFDDIGGLTPTGEAKIADYNTNIAAWLNEQQASLQAESDIKFESFVRNFELQDVQRQNQLALGQLLLTDPVAFFLFTRFQQMGIPLFGEDPFRSLVPQGQGQGAAPTPPLPSLSGLIEGTESFEGSAALSQVGQGALSAVQDNPRDTEAFGTLQRQFGALSAPGVPEVGTGQAGTSQAGGFPAGLPFTFDPTAIEGIATELGGLSSQSFFSRISPTTFGALDPIQQAIFQAEAGLRGFTPESLQELLRRVTPQSARRPRVTV